MRVQLIDKYTDLPENWKEDLVKECCEFEDPSEEYVADCCYRDWNIRLRSVKATYKSKQEEVRIEEKVLETLTGKRDRMKTWYEELSSADEMVHKVCNLLEHLKSHVKDISETTDHTADAVLLLFCMIRDIYGQIDQIKERYDDVVQCIECLDDPVFVEGTGILLCLQEYYTGLDAIIKTRDDLVALIIKALDLSNQLYNNVGAEYGLNNVFIYWKKIFKCKSPHKDEESASEDSEDTAQEEKGQHHHHHHHDEETRKCSIVPAFDMPFCDNKYYQDKKKEVEELEGVIAGLQDELNVLKEDEKRLLACKESLEKAKDLVDPKARC